LTAGQLLLAASGEPEPAAARQRGSGAATGALYYVI